MRRALYLVLLVVTGGVLGCAGEPGGEVGDVGRLQLPLTTLADDGQTYVLSNAVFDCYGPTTETFVAPDDGTDISAEVALGQYSIVLRDGWQLSQRQADGTLAAVAAVLGSENPLPVRVLPGAPTIAPFEFLLGAGGGTLRISFGVATKVSVIAGHFHVDEDYRFDPEHQPIDNGFTGLRGQDVDYEARFVLDHAENQPSEDGNRRIYFGRSPHLTFSGDPNAPLAGELARELDGNLMWITLRITPSGTKMTISFDDEYASGSLHFDIGPVDVAATIDDTGFPVLPAGVGQLASGPYGDITVRRLVRVAPSVQNIEANLTATGDVFVKL
jgi:hypothetical protein